MVERGIQKLRHVGILAMCVPFPSRPESRRTVLLWTFEKPDGRRCHLFLAGGKLPSPGPWDGRISGGGPSIITRFSTR